MTAADISRALGGSGRSGGWWRCLCPVHGSRGAALALRDGERGLLLKCFGGCRPRDVLAELRRRGLMDDDSGRIDAPDPAELQRRRDAEARDRQRRILLARDIIASALPAHGTPVERYLRRRDITILPSAIRYLPMGHPYARHACGGRRPVMVAAVKHVENGIIGAHRTWLALDGSSKVSLAPVRPATGPIGGGVARLAPAAETLLVGEGIETCLAAMRATAMPAWAALSAGGIEKLILPVIVGTVIILADNDQNGVGERAGRRAALNWLAEGRRARIAMPREPGMDWADVLAGRGYSRIVEARRDAA